MNPRPQTKPTEDSTLVCGYPAGCGVLILMFGLVFIIAGAFVSAKHASIPFKVNGQLQGPTPAWFGLIFIVPGLAMSAFAIYQFMVSKRETIRVGANSITWTGYDGKVKLQSTFDDVLPGTFAVSNSNKGQVSAYEVLTRQGRLKWSTQIDYCDRLVSLFKDLSSHPKAQGETETVAPEQADFTCSYPPGPAFGPLAFGTVMVAVAFAMAFIQPLALSGGAIFSIPEGLLGGFILWSGISTLASAKNETISVRQGRIVWIGPFGKTLLDCAVTDVEPKSYSVVKYNSGKVRNYGLRTSKGELKWEPDLNNINLLSELADTLAGPPV
ncbi:MAG TPA: hypothetical protein VGL56_12585 [Fimbriimonadaceae bacterium]|jgi:hypothetical protein